jgi:hypothetical protein
MSQGLKCAKLWHFLHLLFIEAYKLSLLRLNFNVGSRVDFRLPFLLDDNCHLRYFFGLLAPLSSLYELHFAQASLISCPVNFIFWTIVHSAVWFSHHVLLLYKSNPFCRVFQHGTEMECSPVYLTLLVSVRC